MQMGEKAMVVGGEDEDRVLIGEKAKAGAGGVLVRSFLCASTCRSSAAAAAFAVSDIT